ncbi:hypothetical protein ACSBR2_012430 [Camellia fascicularis]
MTFAAALLCFGRLFFASYRLYRKYIAHVSDSGRYVAGIGRYGREIHSHRYTVEYPTRWWHIPKSRWTAKKVGTYAGEKAAAVETGKSAAGYARKVAVDVKDKAAVAGWGAAHYTCEKTVEATLAATNVAQGVAGYTGDKVVAAKDVVAHAGQRAVEYTGEKVAAAKDAVVATEESAKEYTARKKAEAERELQARKSTQSKV